MCMEYVCVNRLYELPISTFVNKKTKEIYDNYMIANKINKILLYLHENCWIIS